MGLPTISGEFRIGSDPRNGYASGSGIAYWSARCVMAARKQDPPNSGTWVDDKEKEMWINLSTYRGVAENMINSGFKKGDLITVTNAPIYLRKYQTDQGEQRISVEVEAKEVGASLTFRSYPHHERSGAKQQTAPPQNQPMQEGNPVDTPGWATAGSESRDFGWGGQGEL